MIGNGVKLQLLKDKRSQKAGAGSNETDIMLWGFEYVGVRWRDRKAFSVGRTMDRNLTGKTGGTEILELLRKVMCGRTTIFEDPLRLGRRGTELLPTLLETHTPDAVVLMLGTNDCKTIFGASAEIIGKGIARLLEQINQYADKMKVLVISPIYLGEKVWQDGYDQEFSPDP